ncbi:lysylphosphatidylglycerol synthetase family protein [Fulvivirgaceae bacterium PWU4]|uniref:Phosphatidylglycerol lysyltransferase n=1 Tax=Chryseosolibacter histidini TaxID=2782349 RepID=A0AAP2DLW2_9BACT|nr:phosphatidylglycerol lysyltransferase domain-containing protein [Chryseosolibacter histidini]MBT1697302.1 lysylphosphatidylglycerol synthetase family protein [Chryseosolibacter histidini]
MNRTIKFPHRGLNSSFIRVVMAGLGLSLFICFLKAQHLDLVAIKTILTRANPFALMVGVVITGLYIVLQGMLYQYSFRSIGARISIKEAVNLFLKRNFVGTFLPAGTFTSLAFFEGELHSKVSKAEIRYGSFLFALASLGSVLLVSIPSLLILLTRHQVRTVDLVAAVLMLALTGTIALCGYILLRRKGVLYHWVCQKFPRLTAHLHEVGSKSFSATTFAKACLISCVLEVTGVAHLYIALAAIGLQPSVETSVIGYAIMVVVLSISPFLKGLGAIEISLSYVQTLYGYPAIGAATAALLFRFFEFWLPLLASVGAFVFKKGSLVLRLFPAALLFSMGIVNIVSGLTPALPERLYFLRNFIPLPVSQLSTLAVILAGVLMLLSSAFLMNGARNAWWMALVISIVSFIAHLTKALDYEESLLALLMCGILVYTRKAYFVRHDRVFQLRSFQKAVILYALLFFLSTAGFYIVQGGGSLERHKISHVAVTAVENMAFINHDLAGKNGEYFLICVIQLCSASIMVYMLVSLYFKSIEKTGITADFDEARLLVQKYGTSSMDYFKTYPDKELFFDPSNDSFLAYTASARYAVVLENPVAPDMKAGSAILRAFEDHCKTIGRRTFYYRVSEEDLPLYTSLEKQFILIGQEAIVDLRGFSLEGNEKKSLRHAVHKLESTGYRFNAYSPPLRESLIQQLRTVSDDWLHQNGHHEAGFSQGVFDEAMLKNCTILTVENHDQKIFAFLNVIPSYRSGECTYDLIRHTADSPNGVLDYLLVKTIEFFGDNDFKTLNLGLVPMAAGAAAKINGLMKFYRDHFRQASRFNKSFVYKNKFGPVWENRYLVYHDTLDLLRFPSVLNAISKARVGSK